MALWLSGMARDYRSRPSVAYISSFHCYFLSVCMFLRVIRRPVAFPKCCDEEAQPRETEVVRQNKGKSRKGNEMCANVVDQPANHNAMRSAKGRPAVELRHLGGVAAAI
jgi:hypothetical protein